MSNKIAIALITDSNYAMQISVVIASIIASKNDETIYDVNILSNGLLANDITKLQNMATNTVNINIIDVGFNYTKIPNNQKWSNTVFIKFDIPFILKEYDKVIYLDGDMIVNKDLSEMYNIDLNNNYAAVVPDVCQVLQKDNLKELDNYFCAGMIMFNTKKIREEYTLDSLIKYYLKNQNKFISLEQDAFNYLFGHNIIHLPIRYQYITLYDCFLKKNLINFYELSNVSEIKQENIAIFHYVTLNPWKFVNVPYRKLWDKYFKLSPYYKNLKRKMYNPINNLYRTIRYNYNFNEYQKKLYFNYYNAEQSYWR